MLKPIKTEKIYEIIVKQITDLIKEKQLRPGSRLPSEREIAATLSVSRASVRQAIAALAARGIVTVQQGDGTFISETYEGVLNPTTLLQDLGQYLASEQISPKQIAEVRRLIETEAAGQCAIYADYDICKSLKKILQEASKDTIKEDDFSRLNDEFHMLIAKGSKNRVYELLMKTFIELMNGNMWYYGKKHSSDREQRRKINWKQHALLTDAICNHDEHRARQIMQAHLNSVVIEMTEVFE
jgi:DNA-binding FadR family transcriptional regulator